MYVSMSDLTQHLRFDSDRNCGN